MRQSGLFGLSDHLKRLSAYGDPLEELGRVIGFEAFRSTLAAALAYGDGAKGGRPPYDPVAMLKVLILAVQNNVSDVRMEYLVRDRPSWLRFLGFDLGGPTPDANTIRMFGEKLTEAGALDTLFADFDRRLKERGYLAMGGQIVDATLVAAPKQRNSEPEKEAINEGKTADEIWPDEPARVAQKDTDARWTLKFAKGRPAGDGKPQIDIPSPASATKAASRFAGPSASSARGKVTDGARFDGRMLRDLVSNDNAASDVWADTAYRSQANEKCLKAQGRVSRIHRRKPKGKPMPDHVRRGNATKSKVAPASSMSLRSRRRRWGCSSAPMESSAPWPRSRWPIWPTT